MKSIWKKKSLTKESCLKIICRQSLRKTGKTGKKKYFITLCAAQSIINSIENVTLHARYRHKSQFSLSLFSLWFIYFTTLRFFSSTTVIKKSFYVDNLNVMMILKIAWNRIVLKIDTIKSADWILKLFHVFF